MSVGAQKFDNELFNASCPVKNSIRNVGPQKEQSQFRILIPCCNISLHSLKSWPPKQVASWRKLRQNQITQTQGTKPAQMHKRSSCCSQKKSIKFAIVAAVNQEKEAREDKMQVRRRRRGRRKSAPSDLVASVSFQFYSSTMLVAVLTIALIAQTASSVLTSTGNENFKPDLSDPSRQLFKRQLPADSHHSAAAAQVTFQNEDFDHLNQHQPSNHYEEPLALASGGDESSQDSQQTSRQNKGKRTLYACEEKQLEIECQLGESIQLIRANYGRFSIQICNEHGQLDWKVNCMSSDSFDIIAKSCQAKQSCHLLASNEIFGDACPGTQKYLEVHYQCVTATAANRTEQERHNSAFPRVKPMGRPSIKQGTDVIQPQPGAAATATTTVMPTTINSETLAQGVVRPTWPSPNPSQMQLPNWIPPSERDQIVLPPPPPPSAVLDLADSIGSNTRGQWCPETVWRSIRWPATEVGRLAQAACPAHTQPSGGRTVAPNSAATLYCKPDGQWASRAQLPGRCQSIWLHNLTQRLEAGDAPLSILNELVLRSSPTGNTPTNGLSYAAQNWPSSAYATSSLTTAGDTAKRTSRGGGGGSAPLFGEDLVQMGRIVGRLVDEMGELLARISDDKQRITWAREMIQLIVDLTSNLLDEQHSEAWWDLAGAAAAPFVQAGERQRVAGQLLSGLESSSVLLAGALQHQTRPLETNSAQQDDFQRVAEHVYVSIQSIALERSKSSQRVQVTFPSQTNLMGARWINSEQRFTLNLQVSNAPIEQQQQQQQQDQLAGKHLKIVSVMLRGLGAYMEPTLLQQELLASDKSSSGDSSALQATRSLAINSDLVGFSIVADSTSQNGAAKVDLSAPIELVFKHKIQLTSGGSERPSTSGRPAHCVYWDTTNSDWSTAGCKLMANNRTHSVCACDHLTTFGLLNELDQMLTASGLQPASTQTTPTATTTTTTTSGQMDLVRVHLDSVELTLDAFEMKPIYMARLLDGNLFTSQTGARTFLYVSCSLSGLLLASLLAAAAYNKAHARRLLGSLPAEPPPSLLVANYHNQQQQLAVGGGRMQYQQSNGLHASTGPHSIETSTTNGTSPPTSYSSAGQATSIDLLASKQEQDELNNFYSLLNGGSVGVDHSNYYGAQPNSTSMAKGQQCLQFGSRRHLAAKVASNDSTAKSLSQLASVPCHLIVQMLLLQLLLLLLIESQNLLAWSSDQAKRTVAQNNLALMTALNQFSTSTSLTVATDPQQAQNVLDPLGSVTWLAVFALYYLAAALVCWLLTRMVQLSGHLMQVNNSKLGPKKANGKQYQTIQTISSNALYQQQQQQPAPINRYGQCQLHNNAQQTSASSPSLSNFSNALAGDANNLGRLEQLESRQFGKELYNSVPQNNSQTTVNCSLATLLGRLATGRQLAWLLTHVLPALASSLLVWFSRERGQLINAIAYTSSWASQLAYWPLALNAGWTLPLALYLYCLPSICLALGVVALLMLRRQFSQIYKTNQSNNGQLLFKQTDERNYHLESQSDVTQIQRRRQNVGSSNQLALELSMELKRAKFACLTLLALLALNSICWISFFTHCHQALAASNQAADGAQSNHLILTFASSNLLISLLVCCSQFRQLKRACQLLGVSRFPALVTGQCCHLGGASKSSPASTSSVSSSSYYNNNNNNNNHHHDQQQRQQSAQYGTGRSIKVPTASASQQSLFVISRSRPVGGAGGAMLAEIAQPTYTTNPQQQQQQPTYGGVQQHPMLGNQHLYQQLAAGQGSQQHIYDSTTNLSQKAELMEAQKQRQWNAFQLMAQQQQQQQFNHQPHEPMIHYTLGRAPIGAPFHLNPQQHQSQYFHGPANMTLKPMPVAGNGQQQMSFTGQQQGARNNPQDSFMCPISGETNSHAKTHSASSSSGRQQQQQQLSASSSASSSGEADGPLVAFSQIQNTPTLNRRRHEFSIAGANQSTSPATFGPIQFNSSVIMSNNNQNSNQQQQQQTTEHRPSSGGANQSDNQSFGTPIGHGKLGAGQTRHLGGKQPNYTDALKAAMAQEASQQQHHFRRTNSTALRQQQQQQPHRSFASSSTVASTSPMIDAQLDYQQAGDHSNRQGHEGNIYDVANCGQVASR